MSRLRRTRARVARLARVYPLGAAVIVMQTVGAVLVIALVLNGQGQTVPLLDDSRFEIEAAFSEAGGLKETKQPPVTVAGVMMGTVSEVRYEQGRAIATLELDTKARGRVRSDATVLITPRSALNDLTVDVDPGSPDRDPLDDGALIPESHTTGPVNLDRVAEVLDADTRAHLQVLIDQLRVGLDGRAPSLRAAIRELGPLLDSSGQVASALADRRRLLTRLVGDLDVVFTTLAQRGDELRDAIATGHQTLGTVGSRQAEVEGAMRELAPTLINLERAMSALSRLGGPLVPALERLRPVAAELPGGLRSLRDFVPTGRGLIEDLDGLTRDGRRPVRALRSLLAELAPASRALTPSVSRLEPVVAAVDRNKLGVGEFGSNFSGIFSGQTVNGPTLRALGFFEPIRPENFGLPVGTSGERLGALQRGVALALERACLIERAFSCLARSLVPALPGELIDRTLGGLNGESGNQGERSAELGAQR